MCVCVFYVRFTCRWCRHSHVIFEMIGSPPVPVPACILIPRNEFKSRGSPQAYLWTFFPSIGHHPAAGKGDTLPISSSFPHQATHHFPLPVSGPVGGGGRNLPPCRRLWPSDGGSAVWESSHRVGCNVEPRKSVTLLIRHSCVYETTPSTDLFLGSKLPSFIRLRHSRMRHLGSPFLSY
jgi:hypothetical protein